MTGTVSDNAVALLQLELFLLASRARFARVCSALICPLMHHNDAAVSTKFGIRSSGRRGPDRRSWRERGQMVAARRMFEEEKCGG